MNRLSILLVSFAAACGPSIPAHTGYPSDAKAPWSKPRRIILNERNEATVDGKLDYPKRKRAEWLMVSLDAPGELKVVFNQDTTSPRADAEVEILDEGFNVLAQGEDDEGEDKKTRVAKVGAGKAYVHVYTRGKTDTLEYEMKVTFAGEGPAQADTNFPANVPNPPLLAAIPPVDDAPGKKKPDRPRGDKPPKEEKPPKEVATAGSVRGRISEYSEEGGGVKITIDKGQDHGVDVGWKGYIVNKTTKKKLSGSDFTVKKASAGECEATVGKSVDEVQTNRSVVLSKP